MRSVMRSRRWQFGLTAGFVSAILLVGFYAPQAAERVLGVPETLNPCAAKTINPCAAKTLNPCAAKTLNPCAAKTLNPCAAAALNPCAAKTLNPCLAKTLNACAAKTLNACDAKNPAVATQPARRWWEFWKPRQAAGS